VEGLGVSGVSHVAGMYKGLLLLKVPAYKVCHMRFWLKRFRVQDLGFGVDNFIFGRFGAWDECLIYTR